MRWELTKLLDTTDDLLIIGLCEKCAERVRKKNNTKDWFEKPVSFSIV